MYALRKSLLGTRAIFPPDYAHDPYSDNNPYNAICSRGDLLQTGDSSPNGCYDSKASSIQHIAHGLHNAYREVCFIM